MNHLLISNVTQRDYLLVHIHGWDFHEVASATETCGPRQEASSNGWIRKIRKISLLSFISLEPQELNSVVLRTLSFSASSHVRKTLPGGKKGTLSAPVAPCHCTYSNTGASKNTVVGPLANVCRYVLVMLGPRSSKKALL